jgi:chromatin remodeling complex protein RSC6
MAIKKNTTTPAPATETKTPAKKAAKVVKKTVAKKETEPSPAPVAPATPVAVAAGAAEEATEENTLLEMSSVYFATLQSIAQQINKAKADYRVLEKKWLREIKQSQKIAKKKRKTGNRAPSGFVKPTRISDELAAFLGVESGVEMARTDVTKEITAYIRKHSLQDKDNGRKILPDAKLKNLLGDLGNETLTYFNLQKYMSPHFAKSVKAIAAAAAAAAAADATA